MVHTDATVISNICDRSIQGVYKKFDDSVKSGSGCLDLFFNHRGLFRFSQTFLFIFAMLIIKVF